MILAAGRGTRLAPLTDTTPKPLLPVGGRPLIAHQLDALRGAGVAEVVVNLHHLGQQLRDALGDGAAFGLRITYSEEATLLETGGGIKQALPLLGDAPFIVLNGDIVSDFPLERLAEDIGDELARLVLTPKPPWRSSGDFAYRVATPSRGHIPGRGDSHVYCGIAVVAPELFDGAPEGAFSLRDLYFRAAAEGRLGAYLHQGYWRDIGTLAQYEAVLAEARTNRVNKPPHG